MQSKTPFESPAANIRRVLSADAAGLVWVVGCALVIGSAGSVDGVRLSPFVGRDLALVSLFCAVPLGLILVRIASRSLDATAFFVCCGFCCLISFAVLIAAVLGVQWTTVGSGGNVGYFVRPMWALILVLPSCWLWIFAHLPGSVVPGRVWPWLLTTLALSVVLPGAYVVARCRDDVIRCQELLGQSRLGEASVVLHRLRRLAPQTQIQGRPLVLVTASVDRSVRQLQEAVALFPSPLAPREVWLQRARNLAMLGQTDLALNSLNAMRRRGPEAKTLAGTIHETREEWTLALQNYTTARSEWEISDESDARTAGRIQATTGIAYSLRKQGRYAEAERAYRQLLEFSPTADTHFLLAQFYEDTQQTKLATQHARQAMQMAPERYAESGKRLINKLTTMHFGCFSVGSE